MSELRLCLGCAWYVIAAMGFAIVAPEYVIAAMGFVIVASDHVIAAMGFVIVASEYVTAAVGPHTTAMAMQRDLCRVIAAKRRNPRYLGYVIAKRDDASDSK